MAASGDDVTGPETLVDVLSRRAADDPHAPLVTFAGGRATSVGEWHLLAEDTARALLAPGSGLRPGDVVLTCIRPGQSLLWVLGGVARAGLVEAPLSLDVSADTAMAMARAIGAHVAVVGSSVLSTNPGLAQLGSLLRILTVDDGGPSDGRRGLAQLEDLRAGRPGRLPDPPSPGDPALVMSTSGTTGRPKGVLLPHFAGVRHARRVAASMRYRPQDVLYNAFPWNHVNIRHAGLAAALVSGARLVAVPRFSASSFWDTCRTEGVTAFNFMGAVAAILLRSPPSDGDRRHAVTRAYGGPAPAWMVEAFLNRFGVQLVEAYACTELGDICSNTVGDVVPGTAGRPVPEYAVRLLDDRGSPVSGGAPGRITVRPRVPHISALGYVGTGTPGPTAATGWTDTGDRGRWDAGGRLIFEGRSGDVVRRRGENISVWEVETVVGRLPGVREAAAVGVPSDLTEEDLLLAVVPEDQRLDVAVVREWCRHHLPRHAVPRYVVVLDELPRNDATKLRRDALRAEEVVRSADDAEARVRPIPVPGSTPGPRT
ncbi:AMP-binding protein [Blastococcus sp. BMG 814]|uniref:AMP-binding protein n=1 Tax=Blastococcus carthaginiensis TaxID=3050034 RepID=A0ABT9IBH6_9ACTN|nr:AMP-binding protein [Blastococcus carthaginiensis]MDP5182529.1 AMP-binding protein [Blastococcus carthaginiensis]